MARLFFVYFAVVLIVGCANRPALVEFKQPESSVGDWYVIPSDAPSEVERQKLTVPRLQPYIEPVEQGDSGEELVVTKLVDSLGNPSLKVNRRTGSAWELVDSTLATLDWNVIDRDRRNYKFELDQNTVKRSLLSKLLRNKEGVLNLVLIPQGNETLIVVEDNTEALPDAEVSADILNTLHEYLNND